MNNDFAKLEKELEKEIRELNTASLVRSSARTYYKTFNVAIDSGNQIYYRGFRVEFESGDQPIIADVLRPDFYVLEPSGNTITFCVKNIAVSKFTITATRPIVSLTDLGRLF